MNSFSRQSGFTLIKVMLLSTMASVVVFTSMKDTLVQERLSGNFQKDLNARLQAEKGVFASADEITHYMTVTNKSATLDDIVNSMPAPSGGDFTDGKFSTTITSSGGDTIEVGSLGSKHGTDAANNMVAIFKFKEAVVEPVFNNPVTGCKGVNLSGSGLVDSYNSKIGDYENSRGDNGDVNTVIGDSDVVLSGHSPIRGDVKASGILYLKGSSPVIGNVQSNTGIDISHGSGVRVQGSALTQGFIIHRGGDITGVVRANGNVEMLWGADILNDINDPLDIQYGGTGKFELATEHSQDGVYYSAAKFNVNPNVEAVRVYDPDSPNHDASTVDECDPLALPGNMPTIMAANNSQENLVVKSNQIFSFRPQQATLEEKIQEQWQQTRSWSPSETDIYLFGVNKQVHDKLNEDSEYVYSMKSLTIGGDGLVNIKPVGKPNVVGGDVIWLIDGDFIMTGNSRLHIAKGTSLTIFVTGKVRLGGSAQVITEEPGITESGLGTFNIFSSYKPESNNNSADNKNGVIVSGTSSLYAVIYAPLTSISMNGSGQFFGTVRGATIEANGGSGIHFDEALKELKLGNAGTVKEPAKLEFMGWRYKHPEEFTDDTDTTSKGE
ncbi:pilus assembly PilX N-terminal domain-containing protein [Pseudoalteromonas luteoviolacea]|uniref:DUF7305 domain-containing protein n=1 Tax=Pseudoalteromonas luteoviolacea S4054 TaxID=1129367 RepID=A0A0F6AC72_9GAMM|nr:pilus assembly PilX N-terminal domain-containing protein [Pseudoalteromonas luteoviolacea]AOT06679.1 hypothetical protein S4054249_01730 [Pseudoalteromonas luteoviolacea]AOT11597.1 hypothetical protein S40542_01730 [Pseudoalteromonas luteoviolacea]AOT16509.1 hypothetical protein S4054_01730 [Pseudoalteromonas luteoviolacea]KKE83763.1 hypothetical protein N479_12275 [Pseudoalteromonas luteoviolacea S4054]KZN73954.1 hypothetical protein N481_10980 [Pseudoalteromonas luteoviolacea S4047-1]